MLQASQERHETWKHDKEQLERLIQENEFDERLQDLGHPSKILDGPINLSSDQQKNAISELAVTLPQNTLDQQALFKIAQAVQLYFKSYFQPDGPPPELDQKVSDQLDQFNQDPEKGASEAFQLFLSYQSLLKQRPPTPSTEKLPPYAPLLHADVILDSDEENVRSHFLSNTVWDESHHHLLETIFKQESSHSLAQMTLDILSRLGLLTMSFLDQELKRQHQVSVIQEIVQTQDLAIILEQQKQAIKENLDHLLGLLTNIIGVDQPEFYQSLKKQPLHSDIFKKIVASLFASPAQRQYGMDQQYLQQVLSTQEDFPKNLVSVLQSGLPRGLEGCRLKDAFHFFARLNENAATIKEKCDELWATSPEGPEYAHTKLECTDLETVRFIIFTHIHDRIKASKAKPKLIEMSHPELREQLQNSYTFELTTGKNNNISNYIEHLWSTLPQISPLNSHYNATHLSSLSS
jgi:hypothetical protein